MLNEKIREKLIEKAKEARMHAYAPYSNNFKVGSAVLTESGSIFVGCNIENSSLGATICAERVAIFKAVCEGHRNITAVAVVTGSPKPDPPCGMCLQVISEFGGDAEIIMANTEGDIKSMNIKELMPERFKLRTEKELH